MQLIYRSITNGSCIHRDRGRHAGGAFRPRGIVDDPSFFDLDVRSDAKCNRDGRRRRAAKTRTSGSRMLSGARSLAWVKERNAESMKELTGSADFQALDRRILQILDSEERIPDVQKLGPSLL